MQVGLTYRSTEYLQWWSNLATTTAATLVHAGLVPLARAPLVTVLFALAVAAWQVDARHPLRIWPPPWTVMLAP